MDALQLTKIKIKNKNALLALTALFIGLDAVSCILICLVTLGIVPGLVMFILFYLFYACY